MQNVALKPIVINTITLEARFQTLVAATGFDPSNIDTICAGVSGGSDSLALALLLKAYCDRFSLSFTALIVDHNLRPESAEEALSVSNLLGNHDIKSVILTCPPKSLVSSFSSGDIQNRARNARYDLIQNWCMDNHCQSVFLGHHKGDQLETQLMRLRQGSGLMGFCGIQSHSHFQSLHLYRPFLSLDKNCVQGFLRTKNQNWIEDPSNQNQSFERVYWRHKLKATTIQEPLIHSNYPSHLKSWALRFLTRYGSMSPLGYATISIKALRLLPHAFQVELLRLIIHNYGTSPYPPAASKIEWILCDQFKPGTINGLRISLKQGAVVFAREYKRCKPMLFDNNSEMSASKTVAIKKAIWDDRFLIHPFKMDLPKNSKNSFDSITITITTMGEAEWQTLLSYIPVLKTRIDPRYGIWSLPILNVKTPETILKLYPELLFQGLCLDQNDCFKAIKLFSCDFLGKSLHQSFPFSK